MKSFSSVKVKNAMFVFEERKVCFAKILAEGSALAGRCREPQRGAGIWGGRQETSRASIAQGQAQLLVALKEGGSPVCRGVDVWGR